MLEKTNKTMKLLMFLTILAAAQCDIFDDDTYKIFITSSKGKITKDKLSTGKNVGSLDISFSTVEAIEPDSFCALPNLKNLFLNGNYKFPKVTKQLIQCTPKLTHIIFDAFDESHQELERDAFTDLKELLSLRINDVNITTVGKDMFKGLNLEFLNLVSCHISQIEADSFSTMPNLKELHLGHNHIKSFLPGTFQNLPKLTELMLNKNDIGEINWTHWNQMPSLKSLDFGDNPLTICDVSKIKDYFPNIRSCNLGDSFNVSQKQQMNEEAKKLNLTLKFMDYY